MGILEIAAIIVAIIALFALPRLVRRARPKFESATCRAKEKGKDVAREVKAGHGALSAFGVKIGGDDE